ncbi:disulfide bond formation protein B [Novosphingobium sp. PC22D]|uniref:disulfide bond formation protein B n=1 Tax=Novosphingobium sp. PC22D TaxID=1962403 RepID=UPI000BEFBD9B|nr:disulfide bond formation protein B [Novosphingobium sp. PC22D]PEQ12088.1 disulfide bond formation protein B [Novosphingobium sp. PC22D]
MSEASRAARFLALAAPLFLLGGAYVSQYVFGLYPCEMCWWQRYPHFAALALAGLAFVIPPARLFVALAALAIAVSGLIGGFHAGVEYGWWEGLTACTGNALGHGADPLEAIMGAPVIRCDVAPWSLFGISLAGWNFLFSGAAALAIAFLLTRKGSAS